MRKERQSFGDSFQSTIHDLEKLDYEDINFGFDYQTFGSPQKQHASGAPYVRHRTLKKSSKSSKKKGSNNYSYHFGPQYQYPPDAKKSKKKKKQVHAGFIDQDIVVDFEDMFNVMVSEDFSFDQEYKSSKKSKKLSKEWTYPGESRKSKKSKKSKNSKKGNGKGGGVSKSERPKLTRPPVGMYELNLSLQ